MHDRHRANLDFVFTSYIGEGGRYQIFLVVILACNALCSAGLYMDILWVADPKPHWCALPENASPAWKNLSEQQRLNLTIPWVEKDGKLSRESCTMFDLNYTSNDMDYITRVHNNSATRKCESWEFDTSEFNGTIVEKWSMVCDRRILIATSQSVSLAADPVAAILGGLLTDRFGRRKITLIASILPIPFRILAIFAPNLTLYVACMFIVCAGYMATYIPTVVLGVEIVGPRYRYLPGLLGPMMWSAGAVLSVGLAYFIRERIALQLALTAPLLFFLSYICLIPGMSLILRLQ